MADLLTAADITAIRSKWIGDEVNLRREWGSAPKVTTSAAAGASSVVLKALGTGTITRGTSFSITSGGISQRYTVTADVAIVANAATVSVSPLLGQAISADDAVAVEAIRRSVFNKIYQRELFSNTNLQDFGLQAESRYAKRIASSDDPAETRFKAIELFALREMAPSGSEFWQALLQALDPQQMDVQQKAMASRINALETELSVDVHGFRTCEVYR